MHILPSKTIQNSRFKSLSLTLSWITTWYCSETILVIHFKSLKLTLYHKLHLPHLSWQLQSFKLVHLNVFTFFRTIYRAALPKTNVSIIFHIYDIYFWDMWGYMSIYVPYMKSPTWTMWPETYNLQSTFHANLSISLNKWGCYILNIGHTAETLDGCIDVTLVHIYTKTQLTYNVYFTYYCYIFIRNKYGLILDHYQVGRLGWYWKN